MPSKMTTSVAKGSKTESSTAHNDRKTNLKNATKDKKEKFYQQKGHKHIIAKYTYLNDDIIIKDPRKMYDDLFEDAVKQYNEKQKRDDRKIGKGKAVTRSEKKVKIVLLSKALDFRKLKKADRQKFLASLTTQDEDSKQLKNFLQVTSSQTRRELRKELTQAKNAKTLGEAYYLKQKQSKQSSTHKEFIMQLGNAADFNEMDPTNPKRILKSYDREDPNGIWQRSKHVLEEYVKTFEKRNPYMKICNAAVHMDEQTPHVHMQIVPIAEAEKMMKRGKRRNGLAIKNSFNGALECEGYQRNARDNRSQFEDWSGDEQKELARLMQKELGVTRKLGKTNKFKNVNEYKEYQRQAETELDKVTAYKTKTRQQVKTYTSNQKVLQDQDNKLKQNQELVLAYKKQAIDAQSSQKEAENKRDEALQEKAEAEKARDNANRQARQAQLANLNFVTQLNQRQIEQKAREKLLEARERDINVRALGGTDSQGKRVEGLISRESRLNDREKKVKEKETKLQDFDVKIVNKQKLLDDYSSNLDAKKKQILVKKNGELHSEYKQLKGKYSKDFEQFKEKNRTGAKFVTYASYIYHACTQKFIETIDPSTANTYKIDSYNTSKTSHSMAYDLARGCYQNNDALSGKTGLEACLELAKGRKKRLWPAIKATAKTFVSLVNTNQVKSLVKDLDAVDENGLNDEVLKQATAESMKQEQKRQEGLQKQKDDHRNQIKNWRVHTKPRNKTNDFSDGF